MSEPGQSRDEDGPAAAAPMLEWTTVRDHLRADPDRLKGDADLLAELGLRVHHDNVVHFPALALKAAAHERESGARKQVEAVARANFAA